MAQQSRQSLMAIAMRLYGSFIGKTESVEVGRLVATDVRIDASYEGTLVGLQASYAATPKIEATYEATSVGI